MKFTGLIIRYRYAVLTLIIAITLVMAFFMKDLKVNADVLSYLPDDDPSAMLFNQIGDTFGGNSTVIIGLSGSDVFEAEMLEKVRAVTDSIRRVKGIGHVTSLTNVINIRGSDFGIEIGRLIDEFDIPSNPETLDSLKTYTLSKEMYRGNLVSEDATATLISAKIRNGYNHAEVVEEIREKLSGLPYQDMIYYGGMPHTLFELSNIILRDIKSIVPFAFILISLVLLTGFRRIRGVLLPMITVLIAIIWMMGLIAMLGFEITMLTNIIPVILLAVGSAYAIHVVNAVLTEQQQNPENALRRAVSYIIVPVFLASATTILGFLSFIAGSYLVMIREFGIFSAIGILFAMILSVTFIPAILALSKQKGESPAKPVRSHFFDRAPEFLSTIVLRQKKLILAGWLLLLIASLIGITQIERRVDIVDYFKKDNMVQKGEDLLTEKFHGSNPLYVSIFGDIQSPEVIKLMEETQDFMAEFAYIPYSLSVADLIKQMHDVMGEGEVIPDDPVKIIQLWFLLEGQEIMDQLVSPDYTEGLIQAYVSSVELDVLREIEDHFNTWVDANSTEQHKLAFTGIPVMLKRLDESIINSQTYSLLIASILVILMVSLLLGSFRKGLIAIIPIVITLIILFGIMGIAGIPLDIATVLTGSVTIGIGIDYSIHMISRFGKGCRDGLSLEASLKNSIQTSGKAIFINMLSVSAGFAVLSFSNLVPLQRFGFLIAITMLIAGMASLTLLPLMLLKSSSSKKSKTTKQLST